VGILAQMCEIQDVAYNPIRHEHFVTADSQGRVLLHDARTAWQGRPSEPGAGTLLSDVAVMTVRFQNAPISQLPASVSDD
jgi:hypothetical protein